jgi:uncharacterized protein (TIGR00369 family)
MESSIKPDVAEHEQAPSDNGFCFGCGPDNHHGMQLRFAIVEDGAAVEGSTVLADHYQGWVGFAHGGMVCTLLDEAMAHAGAAVGRSCVTAGIKVRFRRPTPLGAPITIRGYIVERRSRVLRMAGEVRDQAGVVLASAEADFIDRGAIDPQTIFGRIAGLSAGTESASQ